MSTSEIDSILTKVEKLSTEDKKLLIKRVVDLLGRCALGTVGSIAVFGRLRYNAVRRNRNAGR